METIPINEETSPAAATNISIEAQKNETLGNNSENSSGGAVEAVQQTAENEKTEVNEKDKDPNNNVISNTNNQTKSSVKQPNVSRNSKSSVSNTSTAK